MESLLRENGRGVCAQTKKAGAAWVFDGWGMAGKRSDNGAERPAALQSYRLGNYATRKCVLYTDGRGVYRKVRRCEKLFELIKDKEYFVLTTNVDHQFQLAGFDKKCLFYTQGDYGLWQCSRACHKRTYDNEETVRRMAAEQRDLKIPSELVPHCPVCGAPMTMNLRCDDLFVEDAGWHAAANRYADFIRRHQGMRVLLLELGVGANTPGIIKYPFWRMAAQNKKAVYACVNLGEACALAEIQDRSICIDADIAKVLEEL